MSLANDYKGISDRVTVIAATTGNKTDKIRVAAYCRVSTDKTDQVNSFITQMRYYTDYIKSNPKMILIDIYAEEDVPKTLTERFRIDTANNADGKRMAGKDAAIQGVPFGNTPMVYYYSKPAFASQKINIISCEEEKLSQEYPKVRPHGYAEYLEAPYEGAEKSANLAGEEVYKVFNNRIPMNWEEFRYLSKCFTDDYNPGSTTETGSGTHWWFSYGWSVGGDCVGYNEAEKKYEFTVADASKNYLVVAAEGVTVGETSYAAGEIVRYADKSRITDKSGLYEIPSQREALEEFVRLTTPPDADKGEDGGYGVGVYSEENLAGSLSKGKVALLASDGSQVTSLNVGYKQNYDFAPTTQYREYEDGSVYYKGEETFANERRKRIYGRIEKIDGRRCNRRTAGGVFERKRAGYSQAFRFRKIRSRMEIYTLGGGARRTGDLCKDGAGSKSDFDCKERYVLFRGGRNQELLGVCRWFVAR